MADFDNTALNSTVQELWDQKIEEARYAKGIILNRVTNKTETAKKRGDIIHVTIDQPYTVGTISASGGFTAQNYTLATVDITLNQWEQISIRILDRAEAQSFWQPDSVFPDRAGKAFAARYDAQLASLWSSVGAGNAIGDTVSPQIFDRVLAQEAMLRLVATNIPTDDLSWIIHPQSYFAGLLQDTQLTSASDSGQSKNVLTTGYVFPVLGVPVFTSTNIVQAGAPLTFKNLLLHKSAFAIAFNLDNEFEKFRATPAGVAAWGFLMQSLYGFSAIRTDHYVVVSSKV